MFFLQYFLKRKLGQKLFGPKICSQIVRNKIYSTFCEDFVNGRMYEMDSHMSFVIQDLKILIDCHLLYFCKTKNSVIYCSKQSIKQVLHPPIHPGSMSCAIHTSPLHQSPTIKFLNT